MIDLKFKKLCNDAQLPVYAHEGDGCFDLHWAEPKSSVLTMSHGDWFEFRTGLAVTGIPDGHALFLFGRSGHGSRGVSLRNCVGIVDKTYVGEIMVMVKMDQSGAPVVKIHGGDRIAQAAVMPVPRCSFSWVDELPQTARGAGGFGSTGQ